MSETTPQYGPYPLITFSPCDPPTVEQLAVLDRLYNFLELRYKSKAAGSSSMAIETICENLIVYTGNVLGIDLLATEAEKHATETIG